MSVQYVAEISIDLGEKIHIKSEVKPKCEQDITFSIRTAKWELYTMGGDLEASGDCAINGHYLDALIQPQKTGMYKFKYIYEVADEIWIDCVRLRVD